MKQRPILFSTPMVKAIMEGRKTMTRRIMNPFPRATTSGDFVYKDFVLTIREIENECPFGKVGDVLWVRETFCTFPNSTLYKANGCVPVEPYKWKPSIFMPKDAARIWLRITNVRVERLMELSLADARNEGIEQLDFNGVTHYKNYVDGTSTRNELISFYSLWESINGKESLESNPWVWVIEFERIEKPE